MSDEHDKRDDSQDPWADLDAGDLPDLAADFSIPFEDDDGASAAASPADEPADDAAAAPSAAADSDIDAWLNDPGDEPRPPLSVFHDDDAPAMAHDDDQVASDRSAIEIGTGTSGIPSPSSLEMTSDVIAESDTAASSLDDVGFFSDDDDEFAAALPVGDGAGLEASADEAIAFGEEAGNGEPIEVTAAMAAEPTAADPRPRKKSGVGTLMGILVGGLLAIPITLGILLGFGRDPFGIAPMLPQSLAFLAPGPVAALPTLPAAQSTESEPAQAEPAATELAAEPTGEPLAPGDDLATGMIDNGSDPVLAAMPPADPVLDVPTIEPDADPLLAMLEPSAPPLPAAAVEPPAAPPVEPLDLTAVDEAAAAAVAITAEIAAFDDLAAPGHRRELAAWYRSLAAYADSLAALDRTAAENGRGLEEAAANLAVVPQAIAEHPELHPTIARLARDWLGYARRTSDGLIVAGRFQGCRQLGPWWRSELLVGDTEGRPDQLLVVMTRSEPAAEADDLILVTGLALDDDVVWAADLRRADPAAVESGL